MDRKVASDSAKIQQELGKRFQTSPIGDLMNLGQWNGSLDIIEGSDSSNVGTRRGSQIDSQLTKSHMTGNQAEEALRNLVESALETTLSDLKLDRDRLRHTSMKKADVDYMYISAIEGIEKLSAMLFRLQTTGNRATALLMHEFLKLVFKADLGLKGNDDSLEIQELREDIKKQNESNETLTSERDDLAAKLSAQEEIVARQIKEIEDLKNQVMLLKGDLDQTYERCTSLASSNRELEVRLIDLTSGNVEYDIQLKSANERAEVMNDALREKQELIENLKLSVNGLNQTKLELEFTKKQAEATIKIMKEESAALNKEHSEVVANNTEYKSVISELSSQLQGIQATALEATLRTNQLESENWHLKADHEKMITKTESFKIERDLAHDRLQELEVLYKEDRYKILNADELLIDLKAKIAIATKELTERQQVQGALQTRAEQAEDLSQQLDLKMKSARFVARISKEELVQTLEKFEAATQARRIHEEGEKNLKAQNEKYKVENEKLLDSRMKITNQCATVTQKLDDTLSEMSLMDQKWEAVNKKLRTANENLTGRIESLIESLEYQKQLIEKAKTDLDEETKDHAVTRGKLNEQQVIDALIKTQLDWAMLKFGAAQAKYTDYKDRYTKTYWQLTTAQKQNDSQKIKIRSLETDMQYLEKDHIKDVDQLIIKYDHFDLQTKEALSRAQMKWEELFQNSDRLTKLLDQQKLKCQQLDKDKFDQLKEINCERAEKKKLTLSLEDQTKLLLSSRNNVENSAQEIRNQRTEIATLQVKLNQITNKYKDYKQFVIDSGNEEVAMRKTIADLEGQLAKIAADKLKVKEKSTETEYKGKPRYTQTKMNMINFEKKTQGHLKEPKKPKHLEVHRKTPSKPQNLEEHRKTPSEPQYQAASMDIVKSEKKKAPRKSMTGKSNRPRNDADEFALQSKAKTTSVVNEYLNGLMELPKSIDLNKRNTEQLPDFVGHIEASQEPLRKNDQEQSQLQKLKGFSKPPSQPSLMEMRRQRRLSHQVSHPSKMQSLSSQNRQSMFSGEYLMQNLSFEKFEKQLQINEEAAEEGSSSRSMSQSSQSQSKTINSLRGYASIGSQKDHPSKLEDIQQEEPENRILSDDSVTFISALPIRNDPSYKDLIPGELNLESIGGPWTQKKFDFDATISDFGKSPKRPIQNKRPKKMPIIQNMPTNLKVPGSAPDLEEARLGSMTTRSYLAGHYHSQPPQTASHRRYKHGSDGIGLSHNNSWVETGIKSWLKSANSRHKDN